MNQTQRQSASSVRRDSTPSVDSRRDLLGPNLNDALSNSRVVDSNTNTNETNSEGGGFLQLDGLHALAMLGALGAFEMESNGSNASNAEDGDGMGGLALLAALLGGLGEMGGGIDLAAVHADPRIFRAPRLGAPPPALDAAGVTEVSAQVMQRLREGDRAIREARRVTPDGMGNQKRDIVASAGRSYARMSQSRDQAADSSGSPEEVRRIAQIGGANCGEMAHLTFAALAAKGVQGPVQQVSLDHEDHVVTRIGDPRETDDAVVVDGWLRRPKAHLWRESRWFDRDATNGGGTVVKSWNDTRPATEYDFSDVTPVMVSTAAARDKFELPAGAELASALLVLDEQRNFLWDATHPGVGNRPLAYRRRG